MQNDPFISSNIIEKHGTMYMTFNTFTQLTCHLLYMDSAWIVSGHDETVGITERNWENAIDFESLY